MTDKQTDISIYRVASLLKIYKESTKDYITGLWYLEQMYKGCETLIQKALFEF